MTSGSIDHVLETDPNKEQIMKTKTSQLLLALAAAALMTSAFAQGRHDEKPHGVTATTASPAPQLVASDPADQTIALKDGGTVIIHKDGTVYHVNASGKRVRMRDGVVMQGADGSHYLMKNDVVWKQITEKGTLHPNHQ